MDWTSPKSKLPRIHSIHIPSCSHCLVGMQRTNHFRCVLHARSLLSCSQNCLLDCWIVGDLALSRNGDNSVIFILFRSRKLWGNYGKLMIDRWRFRACFWTKPPSVWSGDYSIHDGKHYSSIVMLAVLGTALLSTDVRLGISAQALFSIPNCYNYCCYPVRMGIFSRSCMNRSHALSVLEQSELLRKYAENMSNMVVS